MTAAVRRYFVERYPGRDRGIARWFRDGEQARRAVIAPWLATLAGTSVLDVGTGDGEFLARVLPPRPLDQLWLVDYSARALRRAAAALEGRARDVHILEGDVHALDLPSADVVLVLGVTDYERDWTGLLAKLIRISRGSLIVDFPRAGTSRSLVRRLWLRSHDVRLHTARRDEVRAIVQPLGAFELVATRLHWIVRVDRIGVA